MFVYIQTHVELELKWKIAIKQNLFSKTDFLGNVNFFEITAAKFHFQISKL